MGGGNQSYSSTSSSSSSSSPDQSDRDESDNSPQLAVEEYAHEAGVRDNPTNEPETEAAADANGGDGGSSGAATGGGESGSEGTAVRGEAAGGGGGGGTGDRFNEEPAPEDTPDDVQAFAGETFAERAIADRFRPPEDVRGVPEDATDPLDADIGVRATPASESRPDRFGGWDGYDRENELRRSALDEANEDTGVSSHAMFVVDMKGTETDSYRAFITDYAEVDSRRSISYKQAHSQMATFAFTDAMGIRTPAHTWNDSEEWVAVASVEKYGRSETRSVMDVKNDDDAAEFANNVDREAYVDQMAVQMLAGNTDLHSKNIKLGRDGSVHCFDFDRAGRRFPDMASMEADARKASQSAGRIEFRRDGTFNVDRTDITDRAAEVAYELEESGRKEAVIERVKQYDRLFYNRSGESFASTFEHNIELAADDYRRNQG